VGGHDQGSLRAFDVASGDVRWQWNGDGPAYTSPIVVELGSRRQLITQSQRACIGVSPQDGKLLWEVAFRTGYDQNTVTPVVWNGTIIFGGYHEPTFAVRPQGAGQKFSAKIVWKNPDVPMYMSSPVLVDKLLFGMTERRRGQLFCADASDGRILWRGPPRLGENAALLTDAKVLVVLTTEAQLLVVAADPDSYQQLASYRVAESATWAHPVVIAGGVLIKDSDTLAFWSWDR